MSDVCVIVCAYNGARRLGRTLEALRAMDAARLSRIVVVDNGSQDGTAEAARAHASQDARLRVWSEPSPGKSAALVKAFRETDEPLLAIVDDDVSPDRRWLDAIAGRFDASPRAGCVGSRVANAWLDESGERTSPVPPTRLARLYARSFGDQDLGPCAVRLDRPDSFVMGAAIGVRRRALIDSGWLDARVLDCRRGERMECGEDAELCVRVRCAGWEVWYEPEARAEHRIARERTTPGGIARLRESICASEAWLTHVAFGLDRAEVRRRARRARLLYLKNLATDWRPTRRRVRLAERRGRARGWADVARRLGDVGGPS